MTYDTAALSLQASNPGRLRLPAFPYPRSAMSSQLLDAHACAELRRHGWEIDASGDECVLRKSVAGYEAKVYTVTLRRTVPSGIEAQGELKMHGMTCAKTQPVHAEHGALAGQLWSLLDATEALNVFSDDGLD